MVAVMDLDEYLGEIREKVCSRCVERPPGGPPCEPLGKQCGVEQHLSQLIDSIHEVQSNRIEPYLLHNQQQICEKCEFLHSSICPCPMEYLLVLIVEAVENVDRRLGRPQLSGPVGQDDFVNEPADLEVVRAAYEGAKRTWTGCDWPTQFGKLKLELKGVTAGTAQAMAQSGLDADSAAEWQAAAHWLAKVENHAQRAEAFAALALAAANDDQWLQAQQHAAHAWDLEFATGRPIWRGAPWTWQKLHQAIESRVRTERQASRGVCP
jgi:hypothetical protein